MKRLLLAVLCAFPAACDSLPRDAAGTSDSIEQRGTLRVAVVAGTRHAEAADPLLTTLARRYDARIERSSGPAETLLKKLDEREVDLVLGEFARATPLIRNASFSPSIGTPEPRSGKEPVLRLARKHGENRLVYVTDRMATR